MAWKYVWRASHLAFVRNRPVVHLPRLHEIPIFEFHAQGCAYTSMQEPACWPSRAMPLDRMTTSSQLVSFGDVEFAAYVDEELSTST